MSTSNLDFLNELQGIIAERKANPSTTSYTSRLFSDGGKRIAQKVGEEGVEVALAAVGGDADEVTEESADLLFHLLVLLADQGIALDRVMATLKLRHAQ